MKNIFGKFLAERSKFSNRLQRGNPGHRNEWKPGQNIIGSMMSGPTGKIVMKENSIEKGMIDF